MRPFYRTPYYSIPAPIRPMNQSFFQGNQFGNPFARIPQNIPLPQQGIPGGIPGNIADSLHKVIEFVACIVTPADELTSCRPYPTKGATACYT